MPRFLISSDHIILSNQESPTSPKPLPRRQTLHSSRYPPPISSLSGKVSPSASFEISSRWQGNLPEQGQSYSSTRSIPYAVVEARGKATRRAGSRRNSSFKWMEWVRRRGMSWSWERPTSGQFKAWASSSVPSLFDGLLESWGFLRRNKWD